MLEAVIATGVAAMLMSAIVSLLVISNQTSDRAGEFTLATWSASEGVAALNTIAFEELANTENGGLTFAGAHYSIVAGPETLPSGMTRTLAVRDVLRDAACLVVTTGGTVDVDSKYLVSATTWEDLAGRSHTVTHEALRTRWDDPQGPCFAAQQASQVTFDYSQAEFYGGKQLREVYMTNIGSSAVVIDKVTFTWDVATTIDQVFISASKVWSSTGPGTPAGSQSSVAALDVEDFTINAGATVEINKGQFSSNMGGATLVVSVEYVDGSVYTSPPFQPE